MAKPLTVNKQLDGFGGFELGVGTQKYDPPITVGSFQLSEGYRATFKNGNQAATVQGPATGDVNAFNVRTFKVEKHVPPTKKLLGRSLTEREKKALKAGGLLLGSLFILNLLT